MRFGVLAGVLLLAQCCAAAERWEVNITNPEKPNHRIRVHMIMPDAETEKAVPGPYPFVVVMHGDPCEWWWYEYLANYVVPSGYVVALMASYEPAGPPREMAIDMRYTLDYMRDHAASTPGSKLYKKLSNTAAAAGHSAGSNAALLTMGKAHSGQVFKYQFDAIYSMAPFLTPDIEYAIKNKISDPKVFMLAGSSDCMCPPEGSAPIYDRLPSTMCKSYGIVTHGTHCHFADIVTIDHICYEVELSACSANQKKDRPIVPRNIQLTLSKTYLLHFLDASLKTEMHSPLQQQRFDALHGLLDNEVKAGYMMNVTFSCTV